MMPIDHTMSSYPHTSRGNLLMQKIAHQTLHGLNPIHTSYSYHISLIFDLHNYVLPSFSPRKAQKTQIFRWRFKSLQGQGQEEVREGQMHLLSERVESRECMYEECHRHDCVTT